MTQHDTQSIDHLKAEIEFRAKLARQHVTGEVLLPDYYRKSEHDEILRERVEQTRSAMRRLRAGGVTLAPFLELGAERGQRSLVLANDFAADGIAADLSFHQLRTMPHFAELFGLPRLPLRVCCNANHLPFRTGAFPFVFAYQFLHHFPALSPAVREIHRVMAPGRFYLAEEPYRRVLKVELYEQRSKIYSDRHLRRNPYVRLLESFVSSESSDETEHGVIENDDLDLSEWIEALSIFDRRPARLTSIYDIRSTLRDGMGPRNVLNWLLGGQIEALCTKAGHTPTEPTEADDRARAGAPPSARALTDLLACPSCDVPGPHGLPDHPPLEAVSDGFQCPVCRFTYPQRDGVIVLLPAPQLQALYPELAAG
jgi:SAM-dependent methyltransferase/uncharacterized protein YbaR (Trm112 family)